ncbi:MAG: hypothetical protein AAGK05_00130 [Pseudomonadota bacterium]
MFSNSYATLSHYRTSLKGYIIDYVIRFNCEESDLQQVVNKTLDIMQKLVELYHSKNKTISARLVARVNYQHLNSDHEVTYYHPSYKAEVIEETTEFFVTHMLKISERMDSFNHNGSNLVIRNIDEIHVHINVLS